MMLDLRYQNIKVAYVMPGSVATEFSGRTPSREEAWRLTAGDVAEVVLDILAQDRRALASWQAEPGLPCVFLRGCG
jgi:short-subunit dehydrogenase